MSQPKLVAFVGAKGGTLKSASTAAVSHVIAKAGVRVLMVDADPQADLTDRSGFARVNAPLEAPPVDVAYEGEPVMELTLLRGGRALEGATLQEVRRHYDRALASDAQLVVVDTPPALGPLTTAAMEKASLIIVPAMPGRESLQRTKDVRALAERVNPGCPIRMLVTMANLHSNLYEWMVENVDETFPGMRMKPVIPIEMAAGESALFERPVTVSAPRSRASLAYCEVAIEVLGRLRVEAERHRRVAAV